jgi:tRNA nucleotidyltransferase (CCA-adding enzyme)
MIISESAKSIIEKLKKNGFEAYAVGGCVRDLLLDRKPDDWDVATNAKPQDIQRIFPGSVYENNFGTVGVKTDGKEIIEVTTYRVEAGYTDKRHPDEVKFADKLEDDLARRDFTVNAMALATGEKSEIRNPKSETSPKFKIQISKVKNHSLSEAEAEVGGHIIVDPFNAQDDLRNKIIRAVGNPEERFLEDSLRMMRAVRFACQLDFAIEEKTFKAIEKNAGWLQAIAKERIREEFEKIIISEKAADGIELLRKSGLLKYVIPELEKGFGVSQNRHHIYTVYEHNLLSLKFAAQKKYNLTVRLAALLHDIAKPEVKGGEGPAATFYNHDFVGAKIAGRILDRLRFPRDLADKVALLIRNHMFVYDVGVVTEAAIRRLLVKVGPENMSDLIDLRVADRLGSGVPKAQPYRLRHFQYMVEKVQHDAISVKMLKINGNDIMKTLGIEPGPKIGAILDVLLAEIIEDPKKNKKEYFKNRVRQLDKIDLSQLRQMAKRRIEEKKEEEDLEIKGKYWVK